MGVILGGTRGKEHLGKRSRARDEGSRRHMGSLEAAAQDRAKWKQFVGGLCTVLHTRSDKGLSQVSRVTRGMRNPTFGSGIRTLCA